MHSNAIILAAIGCLLSAITSNGSVVTVTNFEVPTPPSIEVLDPCYLYVKDMKEFETIIDELGVLFTDLQIGGLKEWFKSAVKVSGLIVKVPVIKGQEHRYESLMERYGRPHNPSQRKSSFPREDDEVAEVHIETPAAAALTVAPTVAGTTRTISISTSSLPKAKAAVPELDSRKSSLPLQTANVDLDLKTVQIPVPEAANEKDWFYENPSYNQIRYSIGHAYQLFPEVARLMGYMDSRDCRVHSLHDTEFNISPRYFVNSLISAENKQRSATNVPKPISTVGHLMASLSE